MKLDVICGLKEQRDLSKIGLPAVRIVNGQRGQNLTTILAISSFGTVHSKSFFGVNYKINFSGVY